MKSVCVPENIYGSFNQHLFLGLSVTRFSSSIGWNGQQSELTVNLVEDTCSSKEGTYKVYYDRLLNRQTTTGPDPGFTYPTVGSPCYLRFGDSFEYSGLLQSAEKQDSEGGKEWVVKLVDPTEILRGTQLIIGDYAGSVYGIHNTLNVYGFAESFGIPCPLTVINGASFGSPAGAFGGAKTNVNGMPWPLIKDAVHMMCSGIPRFVGNQFAPYGRLVFRGTPFSQDGYGLIKANEFNPDYTVAYDGHNGYLNYYLVDLFDVPNTPNFWRLSGTSISLMDAVAEVCDDAGYDFYVELIPIQYAGDVLKIIKVRTVYRRSQPTLGQIEAFLDDSSGTNQQSVGVELRNEVTSNLLVGGPVESVYQATTPSLVEPYWGLDPEGNVIPHEILEQDDVPIHGFHVNITNLNNMLYEPIEASEIFITVDELRAALLGEDSWRSWSLNINKLLEDIDTFGPHIEDKIAAVIRLEDIADHFAAPGPVLGHDTIGLRFPGGLPRDKKEATLADIQTIFAFVNQYAQEYYGKKFTVRLPYTCVKQEDETLTIITSEQPTQSGWTEHPTILNLPHPTPYTDFFAEDNGKISCFVAYDNASAKQFAEGNDNTEYILLNNYVYTKAELDQNGFVYDDAELFLNPKAVVTVDNRVIERTGEDNTNRHMKLFEVMADMIAAIRGDAIDGDELMADMGKSIGNQVLNYGIENVAFVPAAAAIPLRSNTQVYGPWYLNGPPGQTKVETDEGLVPWEYGGLSTLSVAGLYKVSQGVTYMQTGEMGNVTEPSTPRRGLGEELRKGAPSIIETRRVLTHNSTLDAEKVYIGLDEDLWTGLDGPNITSINCDIGQNGITTSYSMRTYTPKLNRLAKGQTDRIKSLGQTQFRIAKSVRLAQFNMLNNMQGVFKRRLFAKMLDKPKEEGATPGELLIGQMVNKDDIRRTGVILADPQEAINEFTEDYAKKAIGSLDVLFRPIAKTKTDDLPGYVIPNGSITALRHVSRQIEPPILNYNPVQISTQSLDPVKDINDDKYHSGQTRHDIEILAYGDEPPEESMVLPVRAGQTTEAETYNENNYRYPAVRCPIMLHGWGFDLDGKPVPNEVDPGGGVFTSSGLTDRFKTNWLQNPQDWVTAPLDIRYDRERGVWTFSSGFRIVRARLDGDLRKSTGWKAPAHILVNDGKPIEDSDGTKVTSKQIEVWCPLIELDGPAANVAIDEAKVPDPYARSGDVVVAYYDSSKDRYYCFYSINTNSKVKWGLVIDNPVSDVVNDPLAYYSVTVSPILDIDPFTPGPDFLTTPTIRVLLPHRNHWLSNPCIGMGSIIGYLESQGASSARQYVCVTAYDEGIHMFYGEILEDSLPAYSTTDSQGNVRENRASFPDFDVKIYLGDDTSILGTETITVSCKNKLQQPVLSGMTGYFYRKMMPGELSYDFPYDPIEGTTYADEWWLFRANHCPLCVSTNIEFTETSGTLDIGVKDRTIYLDTAWSEQKGNDGFIYFDPLDVRICIAVNSSSGVFCGSTEVTPEISIYPDKIEKDCGKAKQSETTGDLTSETGYKKFEHCGGEGGGGTSQQ